MIYTKIVLVEIPQQLIWVWISYVNFAKGQLISSYYYDDLFSFVFWKKSKTPKIISKLSDLYQK